MKSFGGITPFAEALSTVLKQHGLERKIKEHELIGAWEEIVGKTLANYAVPQRLYNGVLYIHVTNATWRQEISLRRTELLNAINAKLEMELVKEIVLR